MPRLPQEASLVIQVFPSSGETNIRRCSQAGRTFGEAGRLEEGGKRDGVDVKIGAMFDQPKNKRGDDGPLAAKKASYQPSKEGAFPWKTVRSSPVRTLQPFG